MTTREFYKQMLALGFTEAVEKLRKRTKEEWTICKDARRSIMRDQNIRTCSDILLFSFIWKKSPEGEKYWTMVYDKVNKKEKANA